MTAHWRVNFVADSPFVLRLAETPHFYSPATAMITPVFYLNAVRTGVQVLILEKMDAI
ncbi:MAG: hypothetical protein V3U76_07500 [Granulosicoccus sp.]